MLYKLLFSLEDHILKGLLVEDGYWERKDYLVYHANTWRETLEILQTENICILVTDLSNTRKWVPQSLREVKKINPDLKVVCALEYTEIELGEQALRLGADEVILKPFTTQSFLDCINSLRAQAVVEREQKVERLNSLRQSVSELKFRDYYLVSTLLADLEFFEKEWDALRRGRLKNVLKVGTKKEVIEELEHVFKDLGKYKNDINKYIVFLNNIMLMIFAAGAEAGVENDSIIAILKQHSTPGTLKSLKIEEWLFSVVLAVNDLLRNKSEGNRYGDIISEIKNLLDQNYCQEISLNSLASQYKVSTSYLSKLFKEQVGDNYMDYLNKIRVDKAKKLLKTTNKRVYEVAIAVGFNDAYYFSSWFKKIEGQTPSQYRNLI